MRGRGNKDTELALAKLFRAHGITGWRRHVEIRGRDGALRRPRPDRGRKLPAALPPGTSQRDVPTFRVKPDFVFPKLMLAVFVDGCFWHGCPRHATWPANRAAWWRRKIEGNQRRDALVTRTLRRAGWRVVRVWEHELARKNQARLVGRIQRALGGEATPHFGPCCGLRLGGADLRSARPFG